MGKDKEMYTVVKDKKHAETLCCEKISTCSDFKNDKLCKAPKSEWDDKKNEEEVSRAQVAEKCCKEKPKTECGDYFNASPPLCPPGTEESKGKANTQVKTKTEAQDKCCDPLTCKHFMAKPDLCDEGHAPDQSKSTKQVPSKTKAK